MTSRKASRPFAGLLPLAALLAALGTGGARAAEGTEPAAAPPAPAGATATDKKDIWPCVWRKVPELDAATIWDGPKIDPKDGSWRKDDKLRSLSQFLISRRIKEDNAEAALKKYAATLKADERDKKLTELFNAVLTRTNEERRTVMSGIERFNKRQMERAAEIEKEGINLPPDTDVLSEAATPAGEIDKLSDKEEKYKWEVRVFQEKQQSIPLACEIPQLMDERAGAVARAIRALMTS